MAHYLITGGAGFIGSHLSDAALARGHRVTVLDDLSTGRIDNLPSSPPSSFRFVQGSVADAERVAPLVAEADVIFHLAATVGVFNVVQHPVETIENNVGGTATVLREALAAGGKMVIVTSTSEVYGKSTHMPFREDADIVLGSSQHARWSYATSKLVDEFLALAYGRQHQLPVIVVRPFNTIGPRQVGHYGMVVPRFLQQALAGKPITIFGDGNQSRCFTYVGDVVEWLLRLVENPAARGEVVNLGNPREITIRQLAERVLAITGSQSSLEYIPYDRAYGPEYEDMQRRLPDAAKVQQLTGYAPQVDLDEALRRTRDWLIQTPSPPGPA